MKDSETSATSGGISVRAFCRTGDAPVLPSAWLREALQAGDAGGSKAANSKKKEPAMRNLDQQRQSDPGEDDNDPCGKIR